MANKTIRTRDVATQTPLDILYTDNGDGSHSLSVDHNPNGVLRAFATVAQSQTDSVLVALVASKKIRVLWFLMTPAGSASTIVFNSKPGGAGSAITPTFPNTGGMNIGFNPAGYFETNAGEALSVTTGAGSNTLILIGYKLI